MGNIPSNEQVNAGSPFNELLAKDGYKDNLGSTIGSVFSWNDYSGTLGLPKGFMLCNGDTIDEAGYESQGSRSAGDWDADVGTTSLDGEDTEDLTATSNEAVLHDVKAATVQGGGFTQGAWQSRILNTLQKSQDWITQDTESAAKTIGTGGTARRFILQKGTYKIDSISPAAQVDSHQTKLRNITDSTDDILGSRGLCWGGTNPLILNNTSTVKGIITLTEAKTFEIQHRCERTFGTAGFGFGYQDFGVNNIYTVLSIQKQDALITDTNHKYIIKIV